MENLLNFVTLQKKKTFHVKFISIFYLSGFFNKLFQGCYLLIQYLLR